jgi:hypothetical protein
MFGLFRTKMRVKKPAFPSPGIGLDSNENWYFVGDVVIVFQKIFPGLRVVNRLGVRQYIGPTLGR